ncbi:MAG: deoxyribodipyrimidine photo-lyase [Arenimonas sp.]|nr:deoxyribodipyrimidine photo-lyase [Arenimonas sp.]
MGGAIVWFRRDLRLADNPALQAALDAGLVPIPVYIHAPGEDKPWEPGAASQAWLHRSLASLAADLAKTGSRLIIRQGSSLAELEKLVAEFDIEAVFWNRLYEPAAIARDTIVKDALKSAGVNVESFNGALLVEPWTVATLGGEPYRVFTPFWRNAGQRVAGQACTPAPRVLPAVPAQLEGKSIASLGLAPRIAWDSGFWEHWQPGEAGAADLLDAFMDGAAHGYKEQRNFPDRTGSSKLSPHLHFGEISPRQIAARLLSENRPPIAQPDLAHFLSELGWREFSHHLLFHYPHTPERNLSSKFDRFPWAAVDPELLRRWQQGQTGVPLVDAGMRELWHTGWMHNRVRMVVASFLTKNLRYHWSHGARWFWDTLLDADLANNTQGWQWSAGTGADAAPYFRIFSPTAQGERFDSQGRYIRRWVPELAQLPAPALFAPWQQPDLARRLAPDYPSQPMIDLQASRAAALESYQRSK